MLFFLWYACYFFIKSVSSKGNIFLLIIPIFLSFFLTYLIIKFILFIIDGKKPNIFSKDFLFSFDELGNFAVTSLLFNLLSLFLLILVVVPTFLVHQSMAFIRVSPEVSLVIAIILAIFWMLFVYIRFSFSLFISLDKNINAIKSLKKSWVITKGKFGYIFYNYFLIACMILLSLFVISLIALLFNSMVVGFVIQMIVMAILTPIILIIVLMLYRSIIRGQHNIEIIKENEEGEKEVKEIENENGDRFEKESEIINK